MKKPLLFLFALLILLAFILGVRYGQRVEKNNKVVDYLLSITPIPLSPSPSPSPEASSSPTLEATSTPTILPTIKK